MLLARTGILAALLGAGGAGVAAQAPPPRPTSLLIEDVTLFGPDGQNVEHRSLLLRDGRITAVFAAGSRTEAADTVVNGRGLFAVPGLIDAHVHLAGSLDRLAPMLRRVLQGGVTTVFDVAGDTRGSSNLQRAQLAGELTAPAVYYLALMAGPAFFTDPRVRAASLGWTPGTAPWAQAITPETDMIRAVAMAKGTGAIGIKLYAALDAAQVGRIVAEARRQGLRTMAHATTFPARPSELVAAGVDVLAHTPYLVWEGSAPTPDFPQRARGDFLGVPAASPPIEHLLQAMRERGTVLNPTLWIFTELLPQDSVSRVRAPWMYAVTRRAAELGIPLAAGTDDLFDEARDPLPILHRELETLVLKAGLTPAQALMAATRDAARGIGIADSVGTLGEGMRADILLLGADPLADIRNTRQIRSVIQRGRLVPVP
jgi:imidazolonepropionase-like amidohydrolase